MAQYINKSALVAEIKKRGYYAQAMSDNAINGSMRQFYDGMKECCQELSVFLDTLEVKDVDLEKEIRRYRMKNPIIQHREESLYNYMSNVAKHFFELGLQAQKGKQYDRKQII